MNKSVEANTTTKRDIATFVSGNVVKSGITFITLGTITSYFDNADATKYLIFLTIFVTASVLEGAANGQIALEFFKSRNTRELNKLYSLFFIVATVISISLFTIYYNANSAILPLHELPHYIVFSVLCGINTFFSKNVVLALSLKKIRKLKYLEVTAKIFHLILCVSLVYSEKSIYILIYSLPLLNIGILLLLPSKIDLCSNAKLQTRKIWSNSICQAANGYALSLVPLFVIDLGNIVATAMIFFYARLATNVKNITSAQFYLRLFSGSVQSSMVQVLNVFIYFVLCVVIFIVIEMSSELVFSRESVLLLHTFDILTIFILTGIHQLIYFKLIDLELLRSYVTYFGVSIILVLFYSFATRWV